MIYATDGKYTIELLEPVKVEEFWSEIETMLDAVPHTWKDHTKESLRARALTTGIQVWAVGYKAMARMVIFTQVAIFPATNVLEVFWGAGEGNWHILAGDVVDAAIEKFAKTQQCSRIDFIGREGWKSVLKDRGFTQTAVVLSRQVVHSGMQ